MRVTTWPCVAHEIGEQCELAGLQNDLAPRAPHCAGEQVDLQIGEAEAGLAAGAVGAPEQRLQPRQQLGEGEGLGQVVVAAGPEPVDPVVHLGERAEDEHRRASALAAQRLNQREAVEARQHAVDHKRVEAVVQREREPVRPVVDELDHVAALAQALLQIAGGLDVVFDDQHVHGRNLGRSGAAIKGLKHCVPDDTGVTGLDMDHMLVQILDRLTCHEGSRRRAGGAP